MQESYRFGFNGKENDEKEWGSSVIVHWLEHTPLLEVQQRVGHRYASSTECYQIHAIKSLQEALKKHHPLEC